MTPAATQRALALLEVDLSEFEEERIAIMVADGIPESFARAYATRRAGELRTMRRKLLVGSVTR